MEKAIAKEKSFIELIDTLKEEVSKIENFTKEQVDFINGIFNMIKETAGNVGATNNKQLNLAIIGVINTLNSEEKVTDGQFLSVVAEALKFAGITASYINPIIGLGLNLASTAFAGAASLLAESTIIQDVFDGALGIFNDVIISLESQGIDFSNSLINPDELNTNLGDVWKDVTGKWRDKLKGTAAGDVLFGGRGDDVLYGYAGNDELYGGTGQDRLYGDMGADKLYGGLGWDILYGGQGNDLLDGGHGHDTLKGGIGDDIYVFKKNDGLDAIHDVPLVSLSKQDGGYDTIRFVQAEDTYEVSYTYDKYAENEKDRVKVSVETIKGEFVEKEDITFLNIAGVLSIDYSEKGSKEEGLISVFGHFLNDKCAIEKIELTDAEGNVTDYITKEAILKVTDDLNRYAKENIGTILTHDNVKNNAELMQIVTSAWTEVA